MLDNFNSMYDSMPALNMLCDIEINDNKVEPNIKQGRLGILEVPSPYFIWMQEPTEEGRTRTAIPSSLIVGWKYNDKASKEEIISTFT